ncbi:ATP-grasp domain-containing protein [Flexivirga oryzae]|uniref:ATP-grasp domain-containing protein n=1 Tax=Flexivirga oryzae TaxID=1794944 RepID=A0A839NBJ5_9MICO|nr:ATP-grasp domain-containing protein [Flexivirga oryzae]MBB2893344.1 hypothetical protein [Flexivirga oryzae]
MSFVSELKEALVGDPDARFVFLGNFEVERLWAVGSPQLPGAAVSFAASTVNRMEELGLLLADTHDVVVLKSEVDEEYRRYLQSVGVRLPRTLVVDANHPEATVTQDAVASPRLLSALRQLNDGNTYLCPLGTSEVEMTLSELSGLPLSGPPANICRAVNSKVYSRRLCEELSLPVVPGGVAQSIGELGELIAHHRPDGGTCTVKEPLGVSGRGQVVIRSERQAASLLRMLAKKAGALEFVVESWIPDAIDINYQVLISRHGEISIQAIKEAVVVDGVHRGHRFPAQLSERQRSELLLAGMAIGRRLFADGYFGIAGIDALVSSTGTVFPCLEINARFNMSTYQNNLFGESSGRVGRAVQFGILVDQPVRFSALRDALSDTLAEGLDGHGILVTNFATVNAAVVSGKSGKGRLYGVITGSSEQEVASIQDRSEKALSEWSAA